MPTRVAEGEECRYPHRKADTWAKPTEPSGVDGGGKQSLSETWPAKDSVSGSFDKEPLTTPLQRPSRLEPDTLRPAPLIRTKHELQPEWPDYGHRLYLKTRNLMLQRLSLTAV